MVQHIIVVKFTKDNNKSVHVFETHSNVPRNIYFAAMELMMDYGINKGIEPITTHCNINCDRELFRITQAFPSQVLNTIDINNIQSIENFMLLNDDNTDGGVIVSITDDSFTYGFFDGKDYSKLIYPTDYAASIEETNASDGIIPNAVICAFNNIAKAVNATHVLG